MPAPVECKAIVSESPLLDPDETMGSKVKLSCSECLVGKKEFDIKDSIQIQSESSSVKMAQLYLGTQCGKKSEGQSVILPEGL